MTHPLEKAHDVSAHDCWILGIMVGGESTGSEVVDSALSVMAGGDLSAPAPAPGVLHVAEPWLAARPRKAWAWITAHPPEWCRHVGAWIQAAADRDDVQLVDGPLAIASTSPAARQLLEMERLARQTAAGLIVADDARLQLEPGFLPSPVCAAFLAARANLDPEDALKLAVKALERQRWESQRDAVIYCLRQAARRSSVMPRLIELLRGEAARHELLVDAAAWTEAAAYGNAFEPEELETRLAELAPRVIDALDPGDYRSAALPLIRAALRGECSEVLYPFIAGWELEPWELIELAVRHDARDDAAWGLVERAYRGDIHDAPGWWQAARDSGVLADLESLVRERVFSGAAEHLPCHPHLLWLMPEANGTAEP